LFKYDFALTLYYIHDPMCSWCYAFKPVLQQLQQQLPDNISLIPLLAGLAPDTEEPMAASMRRKLHQTWQQIQKKLPDTQFNFDFWHNWQQTHPRRSTYPACRAVLAAHSFDSNNDHYYRAMVSAIQTAYYQQALNPSENSLLLQLAIQIGLSEQAFKQQLIAEQTQYLLEQQISQCIAINALSYPSLKLRVANNYWPISIDYHSVTAIMEQINNILTFEN